MDWLGLLFPKSCVYCHKVGKYLCQACLSSVTLAPPVCPGCKLFSPEGLTHRQCKRITQLNGARAMWQYEGVVRKAIIKLKYNFISDIGRELAEQSSELVKGSKVLNSAIIVPIPLHNKRRDWRGFNQSEELAKGFSAVLDLPVKGELLLRIEQGVNQATLDRRSRLRNMRGKYAVNMQMLSHLSVKKVILIDDVWTTGSTLNEAAKVLKEAGINEVWGLTIAR